MADADLYLNVWILAWVPTRSAASRRRSSRQTSITPRRTLAGSRTWLAHAPVTVPVLRATGSALSVLKAMALESFVLNGLALFLLVAPPHRSAAAGSSRAPPSRSRRGGRHDLPQPQYLGTQYKITCRWRSSPSTAGSRAAACARSPARRRARAPGARVPLRRLLHADRRAAYAPRGLCARGRRGARRRRSASWRRSRGRVLVLPAALPYLAARAEGSVPVHDPALITSTVAPWAYFGPGFLERSGFVSIALALVGSWCSSCAPLRVPRVGDWALVAVACCSRGPELRLFGVDGRSPTSSSTTWCRASRDPPPCASSSSSWSASPRSRLRLRALTDAGARAPRRGRGRLPRRVHLGDGAAPRRVCPRARPLRIGGRALARDASRARRRRRDPRLVPSGRHHRRPARRAAHGASTIHWHRS